MSERYAIDTNIAIYGFLEEKKSAKANQLIRGGPSISVQLLNEFANVSIKKNIANGRNLDQAIDDIIACVASICPLTVEINAEARRLHYRYQISIYDALMLAAALADNCTTFYSEDMQHGLIVNDRLKIVNPFLESPYLESNV
jgi:predicted nucleic acid-binding protein